jgi:hypothetical protein
MSKKPTTPFQPAHCFQFRLKIAEEANKRVTSVRCNLYAFFGRPKVKLVMSTLVKSASIARAMTPSTGHRSRCKTTP